MKSLLLVMNPNAGTRQGRRFLTDMIALFNRGGYLCQVYLTEKRGDAASFVREQGGKADLLVACGGDGTLNEVVTGLLTGGHTVPLGYIPCGSTNDFASGLGLATEPLKACQAILSGTPRTLDIGFFSPNRYFTYTASFGAFTQVSWATPQNVKNVLGHAAYILAGIRSLSDIRPIHMKISADEWQYEDDFVFGAVCNSTSLGGVLRLENSEVHMNDGLFEALLIPFPSDLLVLNRILGSLTSHHYDDPSLRFVRASHFCFEEAPEIKWTLDGEEANGADRVEVHNCHSAITLMCE